MRIMQEQVELIREINELRKEISYLKHEKQLNRITGDQQIMREITAGPTEEAVAVAIP